MSSLLRITILNSVGPMWALILAPNIFEKHFYSAFAGDNVNVSQLLHENVHTAFTYFWICSMVFQIGWLWRAETNENELLVISKARRTWWGLAVLLNLFGLGLMAYFVWIPYPNLPFLGIVIIGMLNFIDFLILFWMATATGTAGSYRLVVPGQQWFLPSK